MSDDVMAFILPDEAEVGCEVDREEREKSR